MSEVKYTAAIVFAICLLTSAICAAVPLPSQKHDKQAPIEITSDALEVFQAENRAVFTGHVVAIQAEDRLRSDQMIVYYRKQGEKPAANAKPAEQTAPAGNNPLNAGAIQKIDVKGHVFLSTPEDTASGDNGEYNVEKQLVTLNDQVVLTHGKNVLRGDHLVYNLNTGKSIVTSNGTPVGAAGGKSHRVHALFIPANKDNKDKDKKAAPPPSPSTPPALGQR